MKDDAVTDNADGMVFSEVKIQPLGHTVLETVRTAIVTGKLKPGEPVIQSQLAAQLGISRAPVREALHKLEEEGLVVNVPYKGTIVAPLSRTDIEELRSLRLVLERFAADLLLEHITNDSITELEQIYDRMICAATAGDNATFDLEDLAMHTKICELSGHGLLLEVWTLYAKRFRRVLALRNEINHDQINLARMHLPLLDALRRRDRDALLAFYDDHGTDTTSVITSTWPETYSDDEEAS